MIETAYGETSSIQSLQSSLKRGGGSPASSEEIIWEVEQKYVHHPEYLSWKIKVRLFHALTVGIQ